MDSHQAIPLPHTEMPFLRYINTTLSRVLPTHDLLHSILLAEETINKCQLVGSTKPFGDHFVAAPRQCCRSLYQYNVSDCRSTGKPRHQSMLPQGNGETDDGDTARSRENHPRSQICGLFSCAEGRAQWRCVWCEGQISACAGVRPAPLLSSTPPNTILRRWTAC